MDEKGSKIPNRVDLDKQLNAISGGLLLIWIGFAILVNIGWGTGLIVVGVIILGEQAARRYYSVKFENSWVIAGTISFLAGFLILFGVEESLVPILLIIIGIALLITIFRKKNKQ